MDAMQEFTARLFDRPTQPVADTASTHPPMHVPKEGVIPPTQHDTRDFVARLFDRPE